ncbi:secreted RxLR effector peptide protein, putative [Phytophthora infestans T30-4]|uniref:RxLR effector protein n=1 Tax=Phytophthora infestans (strain T30-4) TaxID=403677 RepID=D0NL06_PHYIT|nr:secreted RxLR effector peptide protein, putative [Phytophthora infestans T30-4]EEY60324.1 secreted RxLR effector peptide protein, putative [Phytophthora infestans T30-4]|eukprot:XP_002900120.1 secreted RxLR effector peptide protein, putative [Phytophthora infestans T30-4]
MRLAYILAMVFAAILHATSAALPVTKESIPTIKNEASSEIDRILDADGGRMLRRAEQHATNEVGVEEERFYTKARQLFNQAIYAAKVKANSNDAGYFAAQLARLKRESK